MLPAVICVGTVLGAIVGAVGVVVFDLGLLAGVGVYFSIAFATMALGIIAAVQQDDPPGRQQRPELPRVPHSNSLTRQAR